MSNKDGFGGGFFFGAIVGGVVGGIVGALLATRHHQEIEESETIDEKVLSNRQKQRETEKLEAARLSLEDKIAQINEAIDDVREQLGSVDQSSFLVDKKELSS